MDEDFNPARTLARAEGLVEDFERRVAGVPYEAKGVRFSEMFFVFATAAGLAPKQILESGRARGQSTHVLGLCFPDSRIISLEDDLDSPDVPVAEERLRDVPNVCLLYGDAQTVLVELVHPGDVVVIDGPKGFAAVCLALRLLRTGKPRLVFVHDCYQGRPERPFLERYLPGAFYSDHVEFVKRYACLDARCWETMEAGGLAGWRPYDYQGKKQMSYGPTFACIPHRPGRCYKTLLARAVLRRVAAKLRRNIRKKLHV